MKKYIIVTLLWLGANSTSASAMELNSTNNKQIVVYVPNSALIQPVKQTGWQQRQGICYIYTPNHHVRTTHKKDLIIPCSNQNIQVNHIALIQAKKSPNYTALIKAKKYAKYISKE